MHVLVFAHWYFPSFSDMEASQSLLLRFFVFWFEIGLNTHCDLEAGENVSYSGETWVRTTITIITTFLLRAAVAEWLSSWLAEQEDRSSIPGLSTWIFIDWLSPVYKSRYGWKIAKSTLILKTNNQILPIRLTFLSHNIAVHTVPHFEWNTCW